MRGLDRRLLERVHGVKGMLAADAAVGVVSTLLVLAQAVLIARIAARGFDGTPIGDLTPELVALAAAIIARAAADWGFEIVGRRAASAVMSSLREQLLRSRLLGTGEPRGPVDAGRVAAVAVDGVDALEAMFARYVPQVVLAVTVPAAVLIVVAAIDIVSAVIMLVTLPLIPIFMWLIGRFTEARARERLDALNRLAGHFLDVVRGLPTLRAFNRGELQGERIEAVSEDYRKTTMGTLRVAFLSGTVLELAATLSIALVAVTVGVRLVNGGIGFEAALTVLLLAPELYLPLRNLGAQFHASADGRAVADLMLEMIGDETTEAGPDLGTAPSPAAAPIRLRGIEFRYPTRDVPVLESVDLDIGSGETVALVGASGVGKSTLATILLGLRRPTAGRVLVGDRDLAECSAEEWRRQLAWIPQTPTIFRGTIDENVRLGDLGAGNDAVLAALDAAGAAEFVAALPGGLETVVGDGGRALSAGERQRIALARAFLRDAPLVVLDEPTANLDPGNAARVGDAIAALCRDRSALLIAHRPELAAIADRVVRLEAGSMAANAGVGS